VYELLLRARRSVRVSRCIGAIDSFRQLIDDTVGNTIVAAHGRDFKGPQSLQAKAVGEAIAKAAKTVGVAAIVFDRAGYRYGGQVKVLADAARASGLIF